MNSDSWFKSCFTYVATALGIIIGIISILPFFHVPNASSLLEATATLWSGSPATSNPITSFADSVKVFSNSLPFAPFSLAIIVFIIILILRVVAEKVFDLFSDVTVGGVIIQALIFLPLALTWVWVFSGVFSYWWIIIFFIGYIITIILATFVATLV